MVTRLQAMNGLMLIEYWVKVRGHSLDRDIYKNVYIHGSPNQTATYLGFFLKLLCPGWSVFLTDFCIETMGSRRSF